MKDARTEQAVLDEIASIQKKMMQVMMRLTNTGNPHVSSVNLELTQLVRTLDSIRESVHSHYSRHKERMGALMEVGSVINSSLGLKRVLDEVMDTLIVLMKAERGFLMLKDQSGDFQVRIARDAKHHDLKEEVFAISKTIVRRVVVSGVSREMTVIRFTPGRSGASKSKLIFFGSAPSRFDL